MLAATRKLLEECPVPRRVIAEEAGVGYEWLAKFAAGKIKDPGIRKVEALHDYLTRASAQTDKVA